MVRVRPLKKKIRKNLTNPGIHIDSIKHRLRSARKEANKIAESINNEIDDELSLCSSTCSSVHTSDLSNYEDAISLSSMSLEDLSLTTEEKTTKKISLKRVQDFLKRREAGANNVDELGNDVIKTSSESDNKAASGNSSEDLITLGESSSVMPHSSAQQIIIGEDGEGSMSEQSTPQKNVDAVNGSLDHPYITPSSFGTDFSFSQEHCSKRLNYISLSDIESEREDPPNLNLEGISKDQLLSVIELLNAYKYKNKYSEVVKNFKELRDEKLKIEKHLIDIQYNLSRQIAELREQYQLEQKAKAHLEENFRVLQEKHNRFSVLETQFERLDQIFNEAKETLTAQTNQITLLRKQNENLSQELEGKSKRINELEVMLSNERVKYSSTRMIHSAATSQRNLSLYCLSERLSSDERVIPTLPDSPCPSLYVGGKSIIDLNLQSVVEEDQFLYGDSNPLLEQSLPITKVLVKPAIVPATILFTYPPPPSSTGSITVNSDDLTTLEDGKHLNDTIIDFYLKFLFHKKLSNLNKSKTYIFSTYFYTCLMKAGDDVLGRHKKVQAWTKNVDLFMKTHIIIPVNQNQHWILVLLCNPGEIKHHENSGNDVEKPPDSDDDASSEIPDGWGKTPYILIFDSVNSNHSKIVSTIRSYLNIEWITKKKTQVVFDDTTMPYFGVKCPQQTNGYDCGVYLLQNFENFFQTPSLSFGEVMSDLSDWFTPDTISGKRTQIKKLIMDLTLDPNALTTIGVEEKHCSI